MEFNAVNMISSSFYLLVFCLTDLYDTCLFINKIRNTISNIDKLISQTKK